MRLARLSLAALGLTLLAGCVSDPGYAPIDPAARRYFGYADTPNGAGGYTIRVVLPEGVEDPKSAFAHWERRAAELCGPAGYRKQLHTARRNMMMMPGYTPTGYSYEVLGDAWCSDPAMAPAEPAAVPTAPAA
ncbi:hypothetical protein [Brevundimonas sp.]|uniref:hypothetical protein n=1 Tax=Brevundimonas sp. TaxID=1871086 RepID=UPI002D3F8A71|nr:hypothetical protein [Brevundimonas sp.]HYD27147.1 hypothetical protein [Brevundimonas sp.]